jgi:hypothetical protein
VITLDSYVTEYKDQQLLELFLLELKTQGEVERQKYYLTSSSAKNQTNLFSSITLSHIIDPIKGKSQPRNVPIYFAVAISHFI